MSTEEDLAKYEQISPKDWASYNQKEPEKYIELMTERLVWQYQKEMHEEKKFEIVSIIPGIPFGPSLDNCMNSSCYIMKDLLNRAQRMGNPNI